MDATKAVFLSYRDPSKRNLKQIAAELGVAHVLEGSVSRAGNRVRIFVQLIDAATDQHRWAETYNRDVSDVFQVQADISAQIAQALAITISPELKKALAHKVTGNSAAYDLYLRVRGCPRHRRAARTEGERAQHAGDPRPDALRSGAGAALGLCGMSGGETLSA